MDASVRFSTPPTISPQPIHQSSQLAMSVPDLFLLSLILMPYEFADEVATNCDPNSRKIFFLGNKKLLHKYVTFNDSDSRTKLSVELNGEELTLEQIECEFQFGFYPALQMSYQGKTVIANMPMTIDAWSCKLMDNLKDPDSALSRLYGTIYDAEDRIFYPLVTTGKDLDFNQVCFYSNEITLSQQRIFLNANFRQANLSEMDLSKKDLRNSNFTQANLIDAKFDGTNLDRTNLSGIELTATNLSPGQLNAADIKYALIDGQPVTELNLKAWIMELVKRGAKDLNYSDLSGIDFNNVDFSNADLRNVNFTNTDLRSANLQGAKLNGAIFTGCKLTNDQLNNVRLTAQQILDADITGTLSANQKYFQKTWAAFMANYRGM